MARLQSLGSQKIRSGLLFNQLARKPIGWQRQNQIVELNLRLGLNYEVSPAALCPSELSGVGDGDVLQSTLKPVRQHMVAASLFVSHDGFDGRFEHRPVAGGTRLHQ